MNRKKILVAALVAALWALPVMPQEEEGTIARVAFFRAKPEKSAQLEEGLKKHMAWHKAQNGTWGWSVWSIETGEGTGSYGAGTFNHKWSDFDAPDVDAAADTADSAQNILPYMAEGAAWRYYASLPKFSRAWPQEKGPAPLAVVLVFRLRMGANEEFINAIAKVHKAIEKTKWPAYYEWYVLVNGGEHPTFVLVLPQENYAAMAPPATSFDKMLEEAFGRTEAEAIIHTFDKTVVSETSEIVRDRPDLSYRPAPAPAAPAAAAPATKPK